ncbi:hypothetical protein MRX96_039544 [Rhipicephalus microplus]
MAEEPVTWKGLTAVSSVARFGLALKAPDHYIDLGRHHQQHVDLTRRVIYHCTSTAIGSLVLNMIAHFDTTAYAREHYGLVAVFSLATAFARQTTSSLYNHLLCHEVRS